MFNKNPIYNAILAQDVELVRRLIKELLDLDQLQEDGNTLLGYAAACSSVKIVELLITEGAGVNIPNINGITPIMFAASWAKEDVIEVLKKAGADLEKTDNAGWSFFEYYASSGNVEAIKFLAKANKDLNIPDNNGFTILKSAQNKIEAVKTLLAAGAKATHISFINDDIGKIFETCVTPNEDCLKIICPGNEDMLLCMGEVLLL